jgi:hypothetical protein
MSTSHKRPTIFGSVVRVAGTSALALALACPDSKTPSFFDPMTSSSTWTIPVTATQIPAPSLAGPFHINHVGLAFTGPVNPASVSATLNGQALTTTQSGSEFDFSLVGKPDGQTAVMTHYASTAGQTGAVTININLLNNGPAITPTTTLPTAITATGTTVSLNWAGTIDNRYIGTATGALLMPGPSNTCADAITPIPIGTVNANTWSYLTTVKANGTYSANAIVTDPSPTSSTATTVNLCNVILGSNIATDLSGNPDTLPSTLATQTIITFPHSSSQLTVTPSYTFNPTLMRFCVAVNTSTARAGQTYSGTLTGPGGSTQTFTGVIDGTGAGHSTIPITQAGAYSGVVTLGTLQATFSVTIPSSGGTSGTC